MRRSHLATPVAILTTAAFLGFAVSGAAFAAGDDGTRGPQPPPRDSDGSRRPKPKPSKPPADPKASEQAAEQLAADYRAARNLVLAERYEEAIKAFKALGFDNHPEVANYIGYASRKLGRYDDAKIWYEKALASDPMHTRTLQYYGMWHLEQGNLLKAKDHLQSILQICGAKGCSDYDALKQAIDTGVISY